MPPIPKGDTASSSSTSLAVEIDRTRPYTFHGVELSGFGLEAVGQCPFCGKDRKFYVSTESGLFHCKVCGAQGNGITFLRQLWSASMTATKRSDLVTLAADRKLLEPQTVKAWGGCRSVVDGLWMLPGWDVSGKLHQLYRRVRFMADGKPSWRLLPTPGIWPEGRGHGFHTAIESFDSTRGSFHIQEGPWDGMAWWEVAQAAKEVDGTVEVTGAYSQSIIADANVIAVPGCTTFLEMWLPMFKGKDVTLWYDSDRRVGGNGKLYTAGFDGVKRAAKKLSGISKSTNWCKWGDDGYDPMLADGWDVRDHLTQSGDRLANMGDLLAKVEPVPASWQTMINGHTTSLVRREIEAVHCNNWATLEAAWADALEWRPIAAEVLATMLAVCASTMQAGGQLFLQVIGSASSGKTTMCDGLLVSDYCHSLEHLSGFHSGWKKPGEDKDCSLIARINGKTLVTPEGDVLMSSPKFTEIMSQCRRIFDGTSGATYKNDDVDRLYVGLRTPWIMAGTPALMDTDQSRLGDRFLRVILTDPSEEQKRRISRKAFWSEMEAMLETSNGTAGSVLNPKLRRAHALTGGYVDWLRANVEQLIAQVVVPTAAGEKCMDLAELTADLRARPNWDLRKHETHDTKEMPYRISCQLGRMARCLAVVFNKKIVDDAVMAIVRKIAFDTAHGHTLNVVRWLRGTSPKTGHPRQLVGLTIDELSRWLGMIPDKALKFLQFLLKIGVLVHVAASHSNGYWKLTERVNDLYTTIMEN